MPKTTKKQAQQCTQHEFLMIPILADVHFKNPIALSYCKSKEIQKIKGTKKRYENKSRACLCCPVFNKDKNYATGSFILPEQKKNFIENSQKYKHEHQCRAKELNEQKTQILIPKPKTKQLYCNVCRSSYQDYIQHTKSDSHKINVRKATFSKHIREMQAKYNKINKGRNLNVKNITNFDATGSEMDQDCLCSKDSHERVNKYQNNCNQQQYLFKIGKTNELVQNKCFFDFANQKQCVQFDGSVQNIPQLQIYQTISRSEMIPMVPSLTSFQCPQLGSYSYGLQTGLGSMLFGFPMLYCNSLNSVKCVGSTFVNMPYTISVASKIE